MTWQFNIKITDITYIRQCMQNEQCPLSTIENAQTCRWHISHTWTMYNVRGMLYVVRSCGRSKIIYSISRSLNAFLGKGMYFIHCHPAQRYWHLTIALNHQINNNNILCKYIVLHLMWQIITFIIHIYIGNVYKCCNFLSKNYSLLMRMARLLSKRWNLKPNSAKHRNHIQCTKNRSRQRI